ncbi:hypothetical protein Tco_0006827 [Tanacetum coccineum]
MSSMKNLDDTFNFGDQFLHDKPTEDEQEKSKVREESDSTIPDSSHQIATSTLPVIAQFTEVSSSKPSLLVTPPPINTEATTITTSLPEITPFIALQLRVAKLEQEMSKVRKTDHSADVLASIRSQVPTSVDYYLGTKLDDALHKCSLSHHNMKKSATKNTPTIRLYHALMEALIADEEAHDRKLQTRCTIYPESEHFEHSSNTFQSKDEANDSAMKDTDNAHIPKVSTTTWFKPIPESERPATPEPEWTIPPNDFPEPENNWANTYATTYKVPEENKLQRKTYDIGSFIKWLWQTNRKKKLCKADLERPAINLDMSFHKNIVTIQPQFFFNKDLDYLLTGDKEQKIALSISKLKAARYLDFGLEELVPSLWVESEREYDISAVYGITHWWFRRKEFYINKHSESSDREAVRSQMRILSVISVKVFEKYGYNYLREIILRRADYQEYKISEKDFKNLHPNDFEDLFLLNIQEKLNHLPKTDKTSLHTAVNMWIRNLVIRNRVGDLQLGIESYQTKINLERPNWDAADYYFKEDYTIVPKPRAVVYRDRNNQRKLMRLNELHKFSDGTLTRAGKAGPNG